MSALDDVIAQRETPERWERMKPITDRIPVGWGDYLPEVGWDAMLLELDAKLAAIDPGYAVYQAKEKFGGLRYYVGHSDAFHDTEKDGQSEAFHGLVREAEEASYKICEYCGAEGKSRNDRHWIKTLCDEHA